MIVRSNVFQKSGALFAVVLAGCSGSGSPSNSGAAPISQAPSAGTGASPANDSSPVAGDSSSKPPATNASAGSAAAGTGGAAAGAAAAPTPAAGASAGAAAAGTGGAPAAVGGNGAAGAPAGSKLSDCKSEDVGPCGTFTTDSGTKLQLGPYGAMMEKNLGKGFEAKLASGDSDGGASCKSVVASFGEDPEASKPLLDTAGIDFALYTVYRPANWNEGEKVPVITWGNGTCAKTEGYGALLRYVASYGFFVVAANSRWVGSGNQAMTRALDFADAATKDESGPFYNRLDMTKVGAMGHSQGGMATITAAKDERVKTVIIWNGGNSAVKPFLAVSGDMDIGNPAVSSLANALTGNPPGAYLFYHKVIGQGSVRGHLTLMTQPERVVEPAVAWFKYQLLGEMNSRGWFVDSNCMLCSKTDEYEYGQKGLL